MFSDLIWGAPQWAWPALGIGVVLSLFVLWVYLRSNLSSGIRVACGILKVAAIVLLAVCLLQPMRSGTRPRPQSNLLPIVVDTSQSMQIKSDSGDQSRHDRVMALVDADATWRTRVAQSFDVRTYAFDTRLQNLDDFDDLQATGQMSSLTTSLQSIAERFAERPVAGLVLFSDGN